MVSFYISLVGIAAGLMAIGLAVPAIIFATVAACLALRNELRWIGSRCPKIKPIHSVDRPVAAPTKG